MFECEGLGVRVDGSGFGVEGLGFRVLGLGCMINVQIESLSLHVSEII